jgi:NADH-quinone oxidoreductase subunit A
LQGNYVALMIFLPAGMLLAGGAFVTAWILRPHSPTDAKRTAYECGELPFGDAWMRFKAQYYVVALLFLLFEIETAFLFPWALIFRKLSALAPFAFAEMAVFLVILLFGLGYAWRKGALEWL